MPLHLDDKTLDIIIKNEPKRLREFNEYISELEKLFQSERILYKIQKEAEKNVEEIKILLHRLIEVEDLQTSSKINGELSQKIHVFRIKYSEFITNDILLEQILRQEIYYDWKEKIQTAFLIIENSNVEGLIKNQSHKNMEEFKNNITSQWLKVAEILLEALEKCYFILSLLEVSSVKKIADDLIKFSNELINLEGEEININLMSILKSIKTTCKAILWELENYKLNQVNKNKFSWKLVIGEHPYEKLSEESRKRIHLLGED